MTSATAALYSVIVPAYKEAGNLEELVTKIFAAMGSSKLDGAAEVIIVDDNSNDGSEEIVQRLAKSGLNVKIIVRRTERGLSSAVIAGLRAAEGRYLLVMDADLQHPPQYVPELFKKLTIPGVEYVLGTRYGKGVAMDKDWPVHRRIISWGARILARPLTPLSDPMSGFFGLRKDIFQRGEKKINAIGYKIALEMYVKCGIRKYEEVPFSFAARTVGESKLTGKVIVHYLKHLRALYGYTYGSLLTLLLLFLAMIAFIVLTVMFTRLF